MKDINFISRNDRKYYRLSDFKKYIRELNIQYSVKKAKAEYILEAAEDGITYRYIDLENLKKIAKYNFDCNDYRHTVGEQLFEIIGEFETESNSQQENIPFSNTESQNEASNILKSFVSQKFGVLRVVIQNDNLWFVGKDVTGILGYTNPSKALSDHVDDEDKLNNESLSSLGQRGGWLINESGLYSLILSSKLPTAKEFKRWVTAEVLPSIRKHGAYVDSQTLEKMISSPEFGIKLLTALKDEREKNKKIQEENNHLTVANKILSRRSATWDNKRIVSACMRTLVCIPSKWRLSVCL